MLIEEIVFSSGELNSGTLVTKALKDETPSSLHRHGYRPVRAKVINKSGASARFGMWTEDEYEEWNDDKTLFTLMNVDNNNSEDFDEPAGEIKHVTASGTTGHTGNLHFIFIRE